MMQTHCLPLGDYQTNCYLIWEEGASACAVIDPGYHAEAILAKAKELGKTPETILRSLQRLAALPGDFRVLPGHAEDTTLNRERQYNPFMR